MDCSVLQSFHLVPTIPNLLPTYMINEPCSQLSLSINYFVKDHFLLAWHVTNLHRIHICDVTADVKFVFETALRVVGNS